MRLVALAASAALLAGLSVSATGTPASAATVSTTLRKAASSLPVASEHRAGYDRDKFRHWVDADGDGCDTREEVLIQESRVRVKKNRYCTVTAGRWRSYYDRRTWKDPRKLDIDHMVPLAEAWDSGARRWTAGTRERFANDLGDKRSLVAVTAGVNRSKSDRDPAQWMPPYGKCTYVRQWVAVKIRWRLTVNKAEKRAIVKRADHCTNVSLRVTRAKVVKKSTTGTTGTAGSTTGPARITKVVYDPAGSDTSANEKYERVVIRNTGRHKLRLGGWKLKDASVHRFRFPSMTLRPGARVTVHSSVGHDTAHHVYAGWGHVWNNTGDTATLRNADGKRVDRCRWGDGSGTKRC
ncbi:MAG TPA: lamin tail domain-containing protein [Segeticoccus sp.]|nr:lamin tail domain-containing protein [Segeticoccus sp.]